MSHHFDSALARTDPRLNIADAYLFDSRPGFTTMVITANTDAGISAPEFLHDESLYSFRFRSSTAGRDEVVFKFSFGHVYHVSGDEHVHAQDFKVVRATGADIPGDGGKLLAAGSLGKVVEATNGVRVFVGTVPEMWAADAYGFREFKTALHVDARFAPEAFHRKVSYFERRNATAIVLEVPNELIGTGTVFMWANISLFGHAPEVQVTRYGLPLVTHLFLSSPETQEFVEEFHKTRPEQDAALFGKTVEDFSSRLSRLAGVVDPSAYARSVAQRLLPALMPYELGTKASFTIDSFNGRSLRNDVLDVMFSLAAGVNVDDGVVPPVERLVAAFPYYGAPFNKVEQQGLAPFPEHDGVTPSY